MSEAIDRVIQLTSGEADAGDALELARWRAQRPEHERAFRQALRLRRDLKATARSEAARPRRSMRLPVPGSMRRGPSRRMMMGGAIAASIGGVAVVGKVLSSRSFAPDFETRSGERRTVVVGDGLSVELNTRTRLNVMDDTQYGLELLSGEVLVSAALQGRKPLTLVAADGRVTTSNGVFNARCEGDRVTLSCFEGQMQVRHGTDSVFVTTGRALIYGGGRIVFEALDTQVTAWRKGLLIFEGRPLAEVIAEVNRYQDERIILLNGSLGARPVNAIFHTTRLETVAPQIGQMLNVRVTRLPGGISVLG